jgi:hypothetical protein
MQVNRVILAANNNELYYPFWNVLAPIYVNKFGIKPTLVWLGTYKEFEECGMNASLGDVIFQEPHPRYPIGWQCTWALFWATKNYSSDTCMIIGIDQIPLSQFFNDLIKDIPNDHYTMLIADAYRPHHHWSEPNSASPSSYHIAKGEVFNKVYDFEQTFWSEIDKVAACGIVPFWTPSDMWGMDESYSSSCLRQTDVPIISQDKFGYLVSNRIECERHKEPHYEITRLINGNYSEAHLCRPYTNHKQYIDKLLNDIPCYIQAQ